MTADIYIKENHIKDAKVREVDTNYEKVKAEMTQKAEEKAEGKRGWLGFIFSLILGLFFFVMATAAGTWAVFAGIFFLFLSFHYFQKKGDASDLDKVTSRAEKIVEEKVFEGLKDYTPLIVGKIYYETEHEITGNIKNHYIGNAYILFPSDPSTDKYGISIINLKEGYEITKYFSIHDIEVCKKIIIDSNKTDLDIDTSALEFASKRAALARLERGITREGFSQSITNDKKLLEEAKEKEKYEKEIGKAKQKIKDETEIFVLSLKDGSTFLISHLKHIAMHKLQKRLENSTK